MHTVVVLVLGVQVQVRGVSTTVLSTQIQTGTSTISTTCTRTVLYGVLYSLY